MTSLKHSLNTEKTVLLAVLVAKTNRHDSRTVQPFMTLERWTPFLFLSMFLSGAEGKCGFGLLGCWQICHNFAKERDFRSE